MLRLHSIFVHGYDALGLYTGLRDKIMVHDCTQLPVARFDFSNAKYDLRCTYPMAITVSVEAGAWSGVRLGRNNVDSSSGTARAGSCSASGRTLSQGQSSTRAAAVEPDHVDHMLCSGFCTREQLLEQAPGISL